jgi:type IV pilus assembly protein PilM
MANNTTTVYISDTGIRLMATRGKRIIKLADMPLDVNLLEINTEEKEDELVEKVKLLFKSNRINARKVILGISGLHCLTRPVSLPELPKAMIEEAITREAKRVLPIPLDQLYLSWQIMANQGGRVHVFMVAVPKHIADLLIRVMTKAGYKPYIMDIKPLALSRISREANAMVVDIQPKEFDIVIVAKGIPQTVRTVPFPQEYLTQTDRLAIVRDELKRTIQFFNSNNPDMFIQENANLLVSGELLDEAETLEFLIKELGFKGMLMTSPLKCLKQLDPSHHMVNVGLALKELVKESGPLLTNINTLPLPYQPKQIPKERLMALPAAAVAIGLVVLLVFTVQNAAAKISKDQDALDITNIRLAQKQAQKKELVQNITDAQNSLTAMTAARDGYVSALEGMTDMAALTNTDLNTVVDNMVSNLELRGINNGSSQIIVNGEAPSEQEIMQYVRKLQDTGRFTEITITNITNSDISENSTTPLKYTLSIKQKEN